VNLKEEDAMITANIATDGLLPVRPGPADPRTQATQMIGERDYAGAIALLENTTQVEPSPANHALLGTAYLLAERYEQAKEHLAIATAADPTNEEWQSQLTLASANVISHIQEDFPPVEPFDREALLAAPTVAPGAIPATPFEHKLPTPLEKAVGVAARVTGIFVTIATDTASGLAGRLGTAGAVWTNWYRKPLALGLATLQAMRDRLDTNNLVNSYPDDALTAFQPHGLVPPPGAQYFRTADGTWNNLSDPKEGAANVRFPRNVSHAATWPETGSRLLTPNPAEISHLLLSRGPGGIKEVPFLNMLAACWIQFMVHDWVSHHTTYAGGVHEVPLPADHPARRLYHQTRMYVPKTEGDPTRSPRDAGLPPATINEVTSWWDGSQIYGSDQKTADSVRSFREGKLRLDDRGLLPMGDGGIEHTGYNRNWWLGLALMHTLFAREHNAICDMLQKHYAEWDDTRLYSVARLINAAVMAKIHTIEWTPAILPNRGLNLAMHANWFGFAELTLHRTDRKVLRPFKIPNAEIGGLVGNPIDKHGKAYGLSEEFTEVYRLHELLPDELVLRSLHGGSKLAVVPLAQARQRGARALTDRVGMANLLYSFGNQHPGQLVLNNFPRTLQQLSLPGNPVYDLGAVDLLRARERGVPRYNEFRRQFGLKPIRTFEDLTTDPDSLAALKRVYDNDVELIDMHVGSRAESQRPTGFGFGETLFQVFILNASRRLQADRFFTDSYNAETYTSEGLAWVDAVDMKSLLLRHFPELGSTGLSNVTNAFEPWDTGELSPSRHPLRAFA
jgi:hypothetical protein